MSLYSISPETFQDITIQLANVYSSQTIAHAGYILGLLGGIAALLSQINIVNFFQDNPNFWKRIGYYSILSLFLGTIGFLVCRLIFWAWMSSTVIGVPYDVISNVTSTNSTTPAFAIQNYTVHSFMNQTANGSFSSQVFNYTYNSLNNYGVIIAIFTAYCLIVFIYVDYAIRISVWLHERWLNYRLRFSSGSLVNEI
jgi:hypothetical protein